MSRSSRTHATEKKKYSARPNPDMFRRVGSWLKISTTSPSAGPLPMTNLRNPGRSLSGRNYLANQRRTIQKSSPWIPVIRIHGDVFIVVFPLPSIYFPLRRTHSAHVMVFHLSFEAVSLHVFFNQRILTDTFYFPADRKRTFLEIHIIPVQRQNFALSLRTDKCQIYCMKTRSFLREVFFSLCFLQCECCNAPLMFLYHHCSISKTLRTRSLFAFPRKIDTRFFSAFMSKKLSLSSKSGSSFSIYTKRANAWD